MGFFNNNNKNERKLSFALGGYTFTSDDTYLCYKSVYIGKALKIARKDIEGVSLSGGGLGKSIVKINGKGVTLGEVELPKPWAEKAQEFIVSEAQGTSDSNKSSDFNDLEKLSDLKNKGVISEEEFNQKKKQILGL